MLGKWKMANKHQNREISADKNKTKQKSTHNLVAHPFSPSSFCRKGPSWWATVSQSALPYQAALPVTLNLCCEITMFSRKLTLRLKASSIFYMLLNLFKCL